MGRPPPRSSTKISTKFICSNLVEQFRTLVKNRELPIPHTLNQGKQFFHLSQFDLSEFPTNCIRSIFYCPQRKQIRVIFNNYCTETNRYIYECNRKSKGDAFGCTCSFVGKGNVFVMSKNPLGH
jgi:hypothetical protein